MKDVRCWLIQSVASVQLSTIHWINGKDLFLAPWDSAAKQGRMWKFKWLITIQNFSITALKLHWNFSFFSGQFALTIGVGVKERCISSSFNIRYSNGSHVWMTRCSVEVSKVWFRNLNNISVCYMASSASGQDELNCALWLATRTNEVGLRELSKVIQTPYCISGLHNCLVGIHRNSTVIKVL